MTEIKPDSNRINSDSLFKYFEERDQSRLMIIFLQQELILIHNTGKLDSDDAGRDVSGSIWRRIFIRSLFAYIEGTCFVLSKMSSYLKNALRRKILLFLRRDMSWMKKDL